MPPSDGDGWASTVDPATPDRPARRERDDLLVQMAQGMTRSVERARAGYEALLLAQREDHQTQREEHQAVRVELDELGAAVARIATVLEVQSQQGRLSRLVDSLVERPVALTAALAFLALVLWMIGLGIGLPLGGIETPIVTIGPPAEETAP